MTRSSHTSPPSAWCSFSTLGKTFTVRLESVCQVVQVDRLIRLPLSPPRLLGLCKLGRDVIPVFVPLATPIELSSSPGQMHRVLVLRAAKGQWGFLVDPGGVHIREDLTQQTNPDGSANPVATIPSDSDSLLLDPEATWQELKSLIHSWFYSKPPQVGREHAQDGANPLRMADGSG